MKYKVIFLDGNLGSGKTTFLKLLLSYMGTKNTKVCSSTFNLRKIYITKYFRVMHFDLYKINSIEEVCLYDILKNYKNSLLIFEWGQKIQRIIKHNYIRVNIRNLHKNETQQIQRPHSSFNK